MKKTSAKNSETTGEINKQAEILQKTAEPFFNCHTHIFNFAHVHTDFLKGMIPWWVGLILCIIGALLLAGALFSNKLIFAGLMIIFAVLVFFIAGVTFFPLKIHKLMKGNKIHRITNLMKAAIPGEFDFLERYANFILHSYDIKEGKAKTQEEIFNNLQSYFPKNTKFVTLSMDMDYMIDCKKPLKKSTFYDQLDELKRLKKKPEYKNLIFPFIHTDPRRLSNDKDFSLRLKDDIEAGLFNGFKIYPALGYFPFDRRLKPMYDLALKYNLPITTHCSIGPVYYRGKLKSLTDDGYFKNGEFKHPFTDKVLFGKTAKQFTPHFTHPLNYYYLMNEPEKLFVHWQKCDNDDKTYTIEDLRNYKKLKICIGHYGGSEEWIKYLYDAWLPQKDEALKNDNNLVHDIGGKWKNTEIGGNIKNINHQSWFSIISDMLMMKNKDDKDIKPVFPNLYADISYNLSDEHMLPLLKVRLETNETLAKKILFGTDFYMVSMKATERKATISLRSFIGEKNFKQIAITNPLKFLLSNLTTEETLKAI